MHISQWMKTLLAIVSEAVLIDDDIELPDNFDKYVPIDFPVALN